jgi:hypothetical protein
MGTAERETCLKALIAAGVADYVPRSEGCMSDAWICWKSGSLVVSEFRKVFLQKQPRSGPKISPKCYAMN